VGPPPSCVLGCIQMNIDEGKVQCQSAGDMACFCQGAAVKFLQHCINERCAEHKDKGQTFFKSACKAANVDIPEYDPSEPLPQKEAVSTSATGTEATGTEATGTEATGTGGTSTTTHTTTTTINHTTKSTAGAKSATNGTTIGQKGEASKTHVCAVALLVLAAAVLLSL